MVSSLDVTDYRSQRVYNWLRRLAHDGCQLGAVSTGTFLLARAGLLTNRRCTIHWELLRAFAEEFPEIEVTRDLFCIDHPTMVKDGSGWGALTGLSAAYLAADGFTGAPALTVEEPEVAEIWSDLGRRWRIMEQYFKPYPVCRWTQPAVEAAIGLQHKLGITSQMIDTIEVVTFHEAVRLAARAPKTTEQAQYSLPFPVAAALARGTVGAAEISDAALTDPEILKLSRSMILSESEAYNSRFPAERWAHVVFRLADGTAICSPPAIARGNPENPLGDRELTAKYRALTVPVIGPRRSALIEAGVAGLASDEASLDDLLADLFAAPEDSPLATESLPGAA